MARGLASCYDCHARGEDVGDGGKEPERASGKGIWPVNVQAARTERVRAAPVSRYSRCLGGPVVGARDVVCHVALCPWQKD